MRAERWRGRVLALGAGAALPLAFAPFNLFSLAVLAPALLFALWRGAPARAAAGAGLLFGLGQFGVGVSWVYVAIHVYGYTAAPVAALLTAAFVAILALYPTGLGALLGWLQRRFPAAGDGLWLLVLFPALWVLFEWLRGWLLTGFPWLDLGYSQVATPLRGWAPLLGVYALSWACALSAGALVYGVRRGAGRGWGVAAALLLLLWGGGGLLGRIDWTHPVGSPLRVRLIQGNLPQLTKWDPDKFQHRLDTYAHLTLENLHGADLIVWPENSLTVFYRDVKASYFDPLSAALRKAGVELVAGLPVEADDGSGRYYAAMMSFGATHGLYRKRHLVPFGEYVPFGRYLRGLIAFFDLPMSSFSPGPAEQPPLMLAGQPAAVTICYEDAFGGLLLHDLPRATLLINGSNNAWYGDSLAPHQHLQISRMRALETGRPLVRATTNGITALVDPRGRITARLPQFRTAVLAGTVQPMRGRTPFILWGNRLVLGLAVLAIVAALGWAARRRAGAMPGG